MPALPPYINRSPSSNSSPHCSARKRGGPPVRLSPPRIPERSVFEKLIQVLVFGCASAGSLRRGVFGYHASRDRRDEWIACGVMETLRKIAHEAYDRFTGSGWRR